MVSFILRFLSCSLDIAVMTAVLLTAKYLLRHVLSGRMQYNL